MLGLALEWNPLDPQYFPPSPIQWIFLEGDAFGHLVKNREVAVVAAIQKRQSPIVLAIEILNRHIGQPVAIQIVDPLDMRLNQLDTSRLPVATWNRIRIVQVQTGENSW